MKKTIGKIINLLSKMWTALIVVLIIGIVLIRIVPLFFGYIPVVCESNSMAPSFYKGSLVYIDTNYDVNSMQKGDIIAFELLDGSKVTHRVYDITEDGIVTKGDANDNVDISPIRKSQIIGKNVYQVPFIGNFFRNQKLLVCVAIFLGAFKILLDKSSEWLLEEEDETNEENTKMGNNDSTCSN